MQLRFMFRAAMVVLAPLASAVAQDTTRGVRIGLTYDPGTRPGVVVLPIRAGTGDSLKAIFERDFDLSNRLAVLKLADAPGAGTLPAGGLNYRFFGTMGAAAVVQATVTGGGVHVALHDVVKGTVINVADFPLSEAVFSREWRHAVHGIADAIEEWITLRRGIAQTRIAFIRTNVVHVVDFDGQSEVALPAPAPALSPAWHPNGRMLAYNTFGPESRIILHDVATGRAVRNFGAQRNVTNLTPTFTPDGRSVVYSISTENGADLYQLSLDGDAFPRRVTVGRGSENVGPSFSPDGNRVAFTSDRTGTPQVYISDADGTNADIFTAFDFGDQNDRASPDWAPDGRQIAFQSRIDGRFQIMTMSIRDRQPRQLTSEGENEDPSWAPDARHLVFVSTRTGTQQLWILDTESGKLRQLTRLGGTRLPSWSPRFGTR
jgi:TolB protein